MSLINEALKKAERERFGSSHHRYLATDALPDNSIAVPGGASPNHSRHSAMIVMLLVVSCGLGALLAYLVYLPSQNQPTVESVTVSSSTVNPIHSTGDAQGSAKLVGAEAESIVGTEMIGRDIQHKEQVEKVRATDLAGHEASQLLSPDIARFLAERIRIQMVIPRSQRLLVLSDDGVTTVTIRAGELVPAPYLVYFSKIEEGVIVFVDGMGGEYRKGY